MHGSLAGLVAFGTILVLGACAAPSGEEPAAESSAPLSADCSSELGGCYTSCQGVTPSPTADCFTQCDRAFDRCLGVPSPELAATLAE